MKIKNAIIVSLVFALATIAVSGTFNTQSILKGIFGGLVFGFLFEYLFQKGVIKYGRNISEKLSKTIVLEIKPGERILLEGGANHVMGVEAVGGKLALTDKRLIFKSHKLNIQNHQEEFAINEIKEVKEANSLLILKLMNNQIHKFNVEQRQLWVNKIQLTSR